MGGDKLLKEMMKDYPGLLAYSDWLRDQNREEEAIAFLDAITEERGWSEGKQSIGYGNSYGYGTGYGDGYGDGSGHGICYSYGHSDGYGDGYDNGNGDGYGYGNGDN